MEVHRGSWGARRVALKYIRRRYFDTENETSKADAVRDYEKAMYDLNFELQIASKRSLCNHRNILRCLALSFDTASDTDSEAVSFFVLPVLIVELAHERFPDLSLFF